MDQMAEKNEIERCDCTVIHDEVVKMVMERMPEEEQLYDLAELFKVFGDSTKNQDPLGTVGIRYVRMRHRSAFEYDTIGHIPSIADTKTSEAGKV